MNGPVRILICEDDEDDAVLIAAHLTRGGLRADFERVDSAASMAEALRLRPPDVVISDYAIPGFGAERALALLPEHGLDIPFILVSGQIGEETAAGLMRRGAHDFILKDRLTRLLPAVQRELHEAEARRARDAALAALHLSEQRFRLFAEHAPDVIFRCGLLPRPDIEYVSAAARTVLGYPPEDLCGDPQRALRIVHPEDRSALEASWRAPDPRPLVVRWIRPDGGTAWTEQRAVGIRDADGRLVAAEGILRDVTDRVAAEGERERLKKRLHQAERLESLGRLSGGIAHDFNNLLAVILGHAELALAELPLTDPLRPHLDNIRELALRSTALTGELLVFSRQQPTQPETLDLNSVVTDTCRVLRRAIGEDIEFTARLATDLHPVTIARSELERLLLNLVVNSRAAMPGGGRLTVETANADTPGPGGETARRVVLSVSDTGEGMTPGVAEQAFDPFFTTHGGAGKGTGLGLSTVYGAVTAAGGEIALDTTPGIGTTVRIELPAAQRPLPVAGDPQPVPDRRNDETVLVVEDDPDVRSLVVLMLARSGFRVLEAASPSDGLATVEHAAASETRIDVMLTDVVMPEMSGIELAARVRLTRPRLPVLLMSGHTAERLPGDAAPGKPAAFVRKPFTRGELLSALYGLLDRNT